MKTLSHIACLAAVATTGAALQARAEIGSGPFSAGITVEVQSDILYDSTNPANEVNDTYTTISAALGYAFGDRTSLNASLMFEPITGAVGDRVFEDHGLYAEELYFAHDFGPAEVILGKFNPAFGSAWDAAPGLYGADFAEDYELTEQVGAAVTVALPFAAGEHALSFAVFNADRSVLSQSLGRRRGQNALSAGGVGNTRGPESMTLSLAGTIGETRYTAGVQKLARGAGDVADQTGAVLGVAHDFGANGAMPVELLAEVAWFDDFAGARDSATIATLGAAVPLGEGTFSAVYALREIDTAPTDRLATISYEMPLTDSLSTTIGYRFGREGGDKNQTIGSVFVYEF